jgi:hypothetical protein
LGSTKLRISLTQLALQPAQKAGFFHAPKVGRGGAKKGERWRMVVEKGGKWSKVGD